MRHNSSRGAFRPFSERVAIHGSAIARVLAMPVWITSPIGVKRCIDLVQWRVMETVPDGTLHFVGQNSASYHGRVSSEIMSYDAAEHKGRTRSGRVYRLLGPVGFARVSDYVWLVWCIHNRVSDYRDVTHRYAEAQDDDA